jgi:hypothetical protein
MREAADMADKRFESGTKPRGDSWSALAQTSWSRALVPLNSRAVEEKVDSKDNTKW